MSGLPPVWPAKVDRFDFLSYDAAVDPTGGGAFMRYIGWCALVLLTACSDPMDGIETLAEQDVPEETETLDAVPGPEAQAEKEGGGFLARLLRGPEPKETPGESDQADFQLAAGDDTAVTGGAAAPSEDVQTASLNAPETTAPASAETPPKRRGLFGGSFAGQSRSTAKSDIPFGVTLPYGQVARICGVPKSKLGKRVEQFPEKRAKYALYDSQPGSTALRTFFLTGFDDGCARQFSAAVAVLASASLHEQLRYGLPAEVQPYSDTDKAYEDLKVRVCKVPRRKPCGSRIGRLENNTVFVSIYERFGGNAQWSNLLVYDGALLAQDKKGL